MWHRDVKGILEQCLFFILIPIVHTRSVCYKHRRGFLTDVFPALGNENSATAGVGQKSEGGC